MVQFLEANPDKAAVWAGVLGIQPSQIRVYSDGLTPVLLQSDTRVTNHGFKSGRATPRQSVLQAGTAVLVDDTGVPKVRCFCGNPLLAPQAATQEFVGEPWPEFDATRLQSVSPGPPTDTFVLRDVTTGEPLPVAVGETVGTIAATTTTAPTATTLAPVTATSPPAAAEDVSALGTVVASSVYGGDDYPADLANDTDPATSWFSAGVAGDGGDDSLFVWNAPQGQEIPIARVRVVGNGRHPQFSRNFGFNSLTIRIIDTSGQVRHERTVELPGTPDPDITEEVGVSGSQVVLLFHGHEAADCGGFAELEVYS